MAAPQESGAVLQRYRQRSSWCGWLRQKEAFVLLLKSKMRKMKVPHQSKRSRPALPVSTPLPPAYPPRHPPPASDIRRGPSSPSAPPAALRSPDAAHAGCTSTSSSPPPPTAYSSAPRCPGVVHPASETRTGSPPIAPRRASSPTQSRPHARSSEDTSAHWHARYRSRLRATTQAACCCRACRYTPPYLEHSGAEGTDAPRDRRIQTAESAFLSCRSSRAAHPLP